MHFLCNLCKVEILNQNQPEKCVFAIPQCILIKMMKITLKKYTSLGPITKLLELHFRNFLTQSTYQGIPGVQYNTNTSNTYFFFFPPNKGFLKVGAKLTRHKQKPWSAPP